MAVLVPIGGCFDLYPIYYFATLVRLNLDRPAVQKRAAFGCEMYTA